MNKVGQTEAHEFMFFGIESDVKNIIKSLRFRRIEKGYSQRDLARITGIKQSAIARMEGLKVYPRIDTLVMISRALDLQFVIKRITTGWDKFGKSSSEENSQK